MRSQFQIHLISTVVLSFVVLFTTRATAQKVDCPITIARYTVEKIQKKLGLQPTGIYDAETERRVINYQRSKRLTADGIPRLETLRSLGINPLDGCQNPNGVNYAGRSGPVHTARYVNADFTDRPVSRPISNYPTIHSSSRPSSGINAGPYIAAVPGSVETLATVRRLFPSAYLDKAREGPFINVGRFDSYDAAMSVSSTLRNHGFEARVIYQP